MNAPRPWLSILLAAYRVEAYVDACAASILAQLEPGDMGVELVFVDDASPDATAARIEAIAARDPRVRLIRHARNGGVSAARNTLLDAARGDYLWYVDPDDLVQPGAIASLRGVIDARPPDLVSCDFLSFDDATGRPRKPAYAHIASFAGPAGASEEGYEALLLGLFATGRFHPWSKVVRRAIWPAGLRFPAGRVFEDLAVYARLGLQVRHHVHVPEVWIAYRQRAGSELAKLDAAKLDQWLQALAGYAAELPEDASAALRLAVAHHCARTLARALRRARRLKPDARTWLRETALPLWASASPLDAHELEHAYWEAGRFGDFLRWQLNAAGRAARAYRPATSSSKAS
ncbi:MAG: glycosyltransferase family 2 protein [Pelomonas sp.]|nr:glycosyltransferase family 2 protein [Roseateles sp.]